MKIERGGIGRDLWGLMPLPAGSEHVGKVVMNGRAGALIRTAGGDYVMGHAGVLRSLPQRDVAAALRGSRPGSGCAVSISVLLCRCARCDHEWTTRDDEIPQSCPSCKSKGWHSKPADVRLGRPLKEPGMSLEIDERSIPLPEDREVLREGFALAVKARPPKSRDWNVAARGANNGHSDLYIFDFTRPRMRLSYELSISELHLEAPSVGGLVHAVRKSIDLWLREHGDE